MFVFKRRVQDHFTIPSNCFCQRSSEQRAAFLEHKRPVRVLCHPCAGAPMPMHITCHVHFSFCALTLPLSGCFQKKRKKKPYASAQGLLKEGSAQPVCSISWWLRRFWLVFLWNSHHWDHWGSNSLRNNNMVWLRWRRLHLELLLQSHRWRFRLGWRECRKSMRQIRSSYQHRRC